MIIVSLHDDTVGFKETFYKGPFATPEQATAVCERFNADHKGTEWSAGVREVEEMPHQYDWEKRVFSEYDA